MKKFKHHVGIDPSSATFAAAIYQGIDCRRPLVAEFANKAAGYKAFMTWLQEMKIAKEHCIICIENTGVYNEALAHTLFAQDYILSLESPQKVKRAFKIKGPKTDPVDATQIAEYACRFEDKLIIWEPKSDIIQQLGSLLAMREQLVKHKKSIGNSHKSLNRKVSNNALLHNICEENIKLLETQLEQIESQIRLLISSDAHIQHNATLLKSVPGIGEISTWNLLVITDNFKRINVYPKLAAYLGICPYKHESGSSIKKRDKSSRQGPPRLRKCLHMGARSLKKCHPKFTLYYERKIAQGKHPYLILNNIANKILRIACAVIRQQMPYDKKYVSIKPISLKTA